MPEHGTSVYSASQGGPAAPCPVAMFDDNASPPEADGDARYLNRELSWLEFNARVLALAGDAALPLLERLKFVAIFAQNLDEFFQVRVAGLKDQVAAGIVATTPDGRTPAQQLLEIRDEVEKLATRMERAFLEVVAPALSAEGITFSSWDELDEDDRKYLVEVFEERIFPVLTPLAVDPGHPFPYISHLSLSLGVLVTDPSSGDTRFARLKLPTNLPRFVVMPDGERFVPLEQVIAEHLDQLFPGMEVRGHFAFRVTRNADLTLEEEEADDLLEAVELELRRRRFRRAVRLEVDRSVDPETLAIIQRELDLADDDIYWLDGPLDLSGLSAVHALDRPDLQILVEYLQGPFSKMENRWEFHATGEQLCDVKFFIAYEFRSRTLGMLMGAMFDAAFRKFAGAFERRADAIYGRKTA